MSNKVVFLVGNGFNYIVKNWISKMNYNLNEEYNNIIKDIEDIISLWNDFGSIFEEIKTVFNNLSDEEIIKLIHLSFDFVKNISCSSNKEQDKNSMEIFDCIKKIKSFFNDTIITKICEINKKFIELDRSGFNSKFKNIFEKFSRKVLDILEEKENYTFVTTNYDGILELLLLKNKEYFTCDGFGKEHNKLILKDENLKDPLLMHLHGSYKYKYNSFGNFVEKLKKDEVIEDFNKIEPVIIFNRPELKEKEIMKYDVLRKYFEKFKEKLEEANTLFIIGQSLKNDPHILNSIIEYFNKEDNEIYILDKNFEKVKEFLDVEYHNYKIKKVEEVILEDYENFLQWLKILVE